MTSDPGVKADRLVPFSGIMASFGGQGTRLDIEVDLIGLAEPAPGSLPHQ